MGTRITAYALDSNELADPLGQPLYVHLLRWLELAATDRPEAFYWWDESSRVHYTAVPGRGIAVSGPGLNGEPSVVGFAEAEGIPFLQTLTQDYLRPDLGLPSTNNINRLLLLLSLDDQFPGAALVTENYRHAWLPSMLWGIRCEPRIPHEHIQQIELAIRVMLGPFYGKGLGLPKDEVQISHQLPDFFDQRDLDDGYGLWGPDEIESWLGMISSCRNLGITFCAPAHFHDEATPGVNWNEWVWEMLCQFEAILDMPFIPDHIVSFIG